MTTDAVAQAALRPRDAFMRGVTPADLRSVRWERLSHGLHAPTRPERPLSELARMLASVLPADSGFGHLTSAEIRGWWLPQLLRPHVLLATTRGGLHVQRRGLYVRRSRHARVEIVNGIPVMSASETLLELARDLTLVDLVPMVDCAMARGCAGSEILAATGPRRPGSRLLRRAVALADPRSESWWESVLRLLHVLTGLGPVDCQVEVAVAGYVVARADLHLVGTNRYPECDGGEHRTAARHGVDLRRDRFMSHADVERFGYTTSEIARRPELIIRDAEAARGLPRDPDRVRRWWAVVAASTVTPYGRTRLAGRLERYRLSTHRDRSAPRPALLSGGKSSELGADDDRLPPIDAA